MPDEVRWIRSYVLAETRRLGRHRLHLPGVEPGGDPRARRTADLPVDEIIKVADTVDRPAGPGPAAA